MAFFFAGVLEGKYAEALQADDQAREQRERKTWKLYERDLYSISGLT